MKLFLSIISEAKVYLLLTCSVGYFLHATKGSETAISACIMALVFMSFTIGALLVIQKLTDDVTKAMKNVNDKYYEYMINEANELRNVKEELKRGNDEDAIIALNNVINNKINIINQIDSLQ